MNSRTKTTLDPDELESGFLKTIPAGRLCTSADVGSAVCYLASDEANFITGVNFPASQTKCQRLPKLPC